MSLKTDAENAWKHENYHSKIHQHEKCEGRMLFGNDLWKHVKKCERKSNIPEPKLNLKKVKVL